jgi:hypothetical protein
MHFTGIGMTQLLQAGAILGALVVALYILKLRRRPIPVPFSPLWQRILRDREATTLWSQLKRLLSLLLQLALVTLLLVALGDPRPQLSATDGRHLVVLVDASASMKASDVPQAPAGANGRARTRLDEGKERVRQAIRGLSGSDAMLIAQLDAAVTPLSTMSSEIAELEAALDKVEARDVRAEFARGLRFALDSLRGMSSPEIVVVSDGALGDAADALGVVDLGETKLSFVGVGEGDRNVAITGFAVRRYPLDKSRYEAHLEVINTSGQPAEVDLELYGDGELTDIVSLTMAPSDRVSRFYRNLSGVDKTLEARVRTKGNAPDLLAADDHAYALLPERKRARIQVVTEGNMYLEAALLLDEYLEVVTVTPARFPAPGRFDATIFDGVAPTAPVSAGHLFYLNPPPKGDKPFKVKDTIASDAGYDLGFDEIEEKHPFVRNVALGSVMVNEGHALEGEDGDVAVGKSFKGTLLLAGRRQGRKFAALGFDLRASDLPLRVAWPLLLLNTLNDFFEEETNYLSSFRTGDVWSIPAPASSKTARIQLPSGVEQVVPIKDGRAVFLGQDAGFYRLISAGNAEPSVFAANLADPAESSIAPVKELAVGEAKGGELSGFTIGVRRQLWIYFLAAVLMVTAIEWLTYHRRVTV